MQELLEDGLLEDGLLEVLLLEELEPLEVLLLELLEGLDELEVPEELELLGELLEFTGQPELELRLGCALELLPVLSTK